MNRCREFPLIALVTAVLVFVVLVPSVARSADTPGIVLKRKGLAWGGETSTSHVYPPIPVSDGRLLVPVKDTLYLIDPKGRVEWSWVCAAPLSTRPIIIGNAIYGACFDLIRYKLDARTGKEIWADGSNGRVTFSQFQRYKDHFYLVVTLRGAYDDPEDELTLHDSSSGGGVVWRKPIPGGATVHVWGDRILAITSTIDSLHIRQVHP